MINRFLQILGLSHQKSLGKLLNDTFWVLVGVGGVLVCSLGVNMLLARLLTTHAMGEYLFLMSVVNFLAILAGLGMPQIMIREVAKNLSTGGYGHAVGLFPPMLQLTLTSSLLISVLILLVGLSAGYGFWVLMMAALLMALTAWMNIAAEALRGIGDYRAASLYSAVLARAATMVMLIACLLYNVNLSEADALGLLAAGSLIALGLAALRIYRWRLGILRKHSGLKSSLGELYQAAWPLMVVGVLGTILNSVDIWVLRGLGKASEVAIYGTAARLAFLLTIFQTIARTVVSPRIASLFAQDRRKELEMLIRLAAFTSGILALLGAVVFFLMGGPILRLLFGAGYEAGAQVLGMLSLGYCIDSMLGLSGICLAMGGYQRSLSAVSVSIVPATIALAILFVKLMGPLGLATAMSLSILFKNVLTLSLARRKMGIWTLLYWRWSDLARMRELFRLMRIQPDNGRNTQDS